MAIAGALTASLLAAAPASGVTTFERIGSLELEADESPGMNTAATSDGTHAYFGVVSNRNASDRARKIVKVKIDGLERVDAQSFAAATTDFRTAMVHEDHLYFGTNADVTGVFPRVLKVHKDTLTSDATEGTGWIELASSTVGIERDFENLRGAHVVVESGVAYGYFIGDTAQVRAGAIVKVRLSDMEVVGYREIDTPSTSTDIRIATFDSTHAYMVIQSHQLVKMPLSEVNGTPTDIKAVFDWNDASVKVAIGSGADVVDSVAINATHVYFALSNFEQDDRVGRIEKGLTNLQHFSITDEQGDPWLIRHPAAVQVNDTHGYFFNQNDAVAKVALSSFAPSGVSVAQLCGSNRAQAAVLTGSELLVLTESPNRVTRLGVGERVECPGAGRRTQPPSSSTGGAVQGDPALDVPVAAAVAAAEAADVAGSSSAVLVRNGQVVPVTSGSASGVGPRGGVLLEAEGLKVSVAAVGGARPQSGVITPVGGEIVCEVCAAFAAGTTIEAWMYSTPQLVAAVQVPDDFEDGDCVLLRIPVGAPLTGDPVAAGAHTLQLRLPTTSGLEVLATGVTVGTAVPTAVPAGGGPVDRGLLGLLGAVVLLAGVLARPVRGASRRAAGSVA